MKHYWVSTGNLHYRVAKLQGRICRHLAALSTIKESDVNEFSATNITKTLASAGHQACLKH
jgi:hypothetical protein